VEEDRSRALSPQERVLHGILTLNYGAFLAFILPTLAAQAAMPSTMIAVDHGWMSWLLTLYAVGSSGFGVREALAARRLGKEAQAPVIEPRPNPRPQNILVTGGTGFIGTALVRRLIERGDKVYVIARSLAKAERLFGSQALIAPSLQALPETVKIDAMVNLAGAPVFGRPWSDARRSHWCGAGSTPRARWSIGSPTMRRGRGCWSAPRPSAGTAPSTAIVP
jgi:hypothetical protein